MSGQLKALVLTRILIQKLTGWLSFSEVDFLGQQFSLRLRLEIGRNNMENIGVLCTGVRRSLPPAIHSRFPGNAQIAMAFRDSPQDSSKSYRLIHINTCHFDQFSTTGYARIYIAISYPSASK
jgi:hypothetical protein